PNILPYLGNSSMRRVRSDVSHRIRRRTSIFTARWFRIALGAGVVVALLLLAGPSVATWLGALFGPWGGPSKTVQSRPPGPVAPRLSTPGPSQPPSTTARGTTGSPGTAPSSGATASASKPSSGSSENSTSPSGRTAASSPVTPVTPPAV